MSETENAHETLKIIEKILDYNKNAQKIFQLASKVDKGKSEPNTEESIAERVKLKNERIAEIKKEEKNINDLLFKHCFNKYQNLCGMHKELYEKRGKKKKKKKLIIK